MVMERLIHLDEVAYVRFASVYQRFDDVRRFAQLLERISRRTRRNSKNGLAPSQTPLKNSSQSANGMTEETDIILN